MTHETWKDCVGFEGRYQVSDLGRVRNAKGHVLTPQAINSGYLVVHLYREGRRHVRLVHRLVGEVYVPNPNNLPEINHDNTNKHDNAYGNLLWSTRLGNVAHAMVAGVFPQKQHPHAVVGTHLITGVETHYPSMKDAEMALSSSGKQSSAINHFFDGRKKSAYGHVWRRA